MNPVIKPINRKYGFTITELLVVIVIILVLAVVLVPTITKLRDRAAATGCASNMRQCIALSLMFTTEQNGRMPRLHVDWNRIESEVGRPLLPVKERTVTNNAAVFWPDLISTYAEAGSTFSCPKLKMNATDGNGGGSSTNAPLGIGINWASMAPSDKDANGVLKWVRLSSVPDPGRLVWFADAAGGPGGANLTGPLKDRKDVPGCGSCFFRGHDAGAPMAIPRHGGKINVGFADGHVSLVNPSEINWGSTDTDRKFVGYTRFF
jgi:prepilin-type processing-associated H-X9-DG protein/prepilin-type N-terminal cleavage/methylation domain-containing protein